MDRLRAGTTAWVAAVLCVAIGALMLGEPRQTYGPLEPYAAWVGCLLIVSGVAFIASLTLPLEAPFVAAAQVVVGAELLMIAGSLARDQVVSATLSLGLLGVATLACGFLPEYLERAEWPRRLELFSILAGASLIACGALLLFPPSPEERASAALLDGLEPWYALGLLTVGFVLLAAEVMQLFPVGLHRAVYVTVGIAFWSYLALEGLPGGSSVGTLYWAVAGMTVSALPWVGNPLRRLRRSSLRMRFALLAGGVSALALISSIAVDVRQHEVRLSDAVARQQRSIARAVAAELTAVDLPSNSAQLAGALETAQQEISDTDERIYVVDALGRPLGSAGPTVNAAYIAGLPSDAGVTTLQFKEADGQHIIAVAPLRTANWWVVVERPLARSAIVAEEAHDYKIALVVIALAAMLGAVAARPLVAPLLRLADAAQQLAQGNGAVDLATSSVTEVAHLAEALAELRDRLASRTAERERAEAALHDANRNLTALSNASPVGVIGLDRNGTVREWNPAAERLLGWSREEAIGSDLTYVFQQVEVGTGPHIREVLHGAQFNGDETRLRTRSGVAVDVAIWTASLDGDGGPIEGSLLIVADTAARRRLEAEHTERLREEAKRAESETLRDRFTFLAEASGDLSSSLDLETTLQRAASVAVPKLADWCTVHLLQSDGTVQTVARAYDDPSLEDTLCQLQRNYPPMPGGMSPGAQALRTGESLLIPNVTPEWLAGTALDERHLELLRRLRPRSVMGVPLVARERILGAVTFVSIRLDRPYDDTSLALAQALARRCGLAIDNARLHQDTTQALKARDTFLSVASHELGGPLARLKLHAEVLRLAQARHAIDDTLLTRSLGSIERASNRLAAITQDLLEVARWQRGDVPIRPQRTDLGKLLREFVRAYRDRLDDRRGLVLSVPRGRHMVLVDPDRIEQVCENLLDNAFKYSPDGRDVRVSLRAERGGALLQVRDTGIGLPAGAEAIIFEPFGRAANAERRSVAGLGLGLYICRSVVEGHGGRIWAESPGESQGTTMNVWLPGTPT